MELPPDKFLEKWGARRSRFRFASGKRPQTKRLPELGARSSGGADDLARNSSGEMKDDDSNPVFGELATLEAKKIN